MKKTYMLYSNNRSESIAFGDIGYIAENVGFYLFECGEDASPIKSNIKSVLKALNNQNDLMLLEVVSKHSA